MTFTFLLMPRTLRARDSLVNQKVRRLAKPENDLRRNATLWSALVSTQLLLWMIGRANVLVAAMTYAVRLPVFMLTFPATRPSAREGDCLY